MKKFKIVLKNLAIIAVGIGAFIIFSEQDLQTRLIIGVYVSIFYLGYLANQHIKKINKEKFYDCSFEKQITTLEGDDVLARFELKYKLPFPPYIGLEVAGELNPIEVENPDYDNHDFQAFYTGKITSVIWRYSRFVCTVEPHKMAPENKLEAVVVAHCDYAWKLDGLYFDLRKTVLDYIDVELSRDQVTENERNERRYARLERVKKKLER